MKRVLKCSLFTIVIAAVMLVAPAGPALAGDFGAVAKASPAVSVGVSADSSTAYSAGEMDGEAAVDPGEKPSAVIMLASDYQADKDAVISPPENLAAITDRVILDGIVPDHLIMCGDFSRGNETAHYTGDAGPAMQEIRSLFADRVPGITDENMIFLQGNHDAKNAAFMADGLHDCGSFLVYVMNTETANPFHQGSEQLRAVVRASAADLDAALRKLVDAGDRRPVLVATHVPLHFSSRTAGSNGDNLYSKYLFNVLNRYGEKLDIVYFFGHNHSKSYDNYLGEARIYRGVGSKILIPKFQAEQYSTKKFSVRTLNFTYMNAGYVGYVSSKACDRINTCSVLAVYDDRLRITRYTADGPTDLGAKGKRTYKVIPKKYTAKAVRGSRTVKLKVSKPEMPGTMEKNVTVPGNMEK